MGGCFSRHATRDRSGESAASSELSGSGAAGSVTIGKNKPLASEKPKWKSEMPMTMAQLRSKRDEYWETQPAFGGRKEIWDALRGACETEDIGLAQAIVNGASITLPTGSLSDAYDELGNHYVIPVYCISAPSNLVLDDEASTSSTGSKANLELEQAGGEEIAIKIRLSSTQKDAKITVRTGETVAALKRRVQAEFGVPTSKQRWFFAGKMLYDKLTVADIGISKGYVVQVIVAPEEG